MPATRTHISGLYSYRRGPYSENDATSSLGRDARSSAAGNP